MQIHPNEVKSVKSIGNLNGSDVKLVTTKGGLYLALGKKSKNQKDHLPLSAGSHPALVMHQLEKEFKHQFQPSIEKSDIDSLPSVTELNCNIKGLSMFTLKKNIDVDVVIAKFGVEICKCQCEVNGNNLKIKKIDYRVGFDPSMKDTLRSELNSGIIQTAQNEGFESFIK